MSRLAKKNLKVPNGVKVSVTPSLITVEGKLGTLKQEYKASHIEIKTDGKEISVDRKGDANEFRALQGLYWRLTRNLLTGVSEGFSKVLNIQGLGYKWEVKGKELVLTVGFSKPAIYSIPEGVTLKVEQAVLTITGCDKQLVGQVAANIRAIKPPEPYKGKGVRYSNERVKLKEGKSAK